MSTTENLIQKLWESDEASALTNQAARKIEKLQKEIDYLNSKIENIYNVSYHSIGHVARAKSD